MFIQDISNEVRIVYYGHPTYDVVVERYGSAGTDPEPHWHKHWETNEISNDYAYTDALQTASALAEHLLRR